MQLLTLSADVRASSIEYPASSIQHPTSRPGTRGCPLGRELLRRREFQRILIIKPSHIGDVVHAVPVLAKLRARYPSARIDWFITPENADLVRCHPGLSNVAAFPVADLARIGRDWNATARALRALRALREKRYDLVIDLHGQLRSAVCTLATGARTRIGFDRPLRRTGAREASDLPDDLARHGWVGAREGAWIAYTHRIPLATLDVHAVDRYLWLGPMLGLDERPPDFTLYPPDGVDERLDALLKANGLTGKPIALLVPCTIWQTKHWREQGFAHVGRHFQDQGMAVVVAGTRSEQARCRAVAAECPGARDLSGQTSVAELMALIRRAAICVTNDSGSMHLAVALGRPVVSVFGPTDPFRIGPYGHPDAAVRSSVPCAPCHLKSLRQCPYDHACMREVSARMVIERAHRILAESPG